MKIRIKRVGGGLIEVQWRFLGIFWMNLAQWSFEVGWNPIYSYYTEDDNILKIEYHIQQFKERLIEERKYVKKPRIIKEFEL